MQSDLESRYIALANVFDHKTAICLSDPMRKGDGHLRARIPVNLKPRRLRVDNAVALVIPNIGNHVGTARLDVNKSIVVSDRPLQNLRVVCRPVVHVGIEDFPRSLPSKADRKLDRGALHSQHLALALDLAKGSARALTPDRYLELFLQEISTAPLILDAC